MIQRLYVHNFRCLENFELTLKDLPSALLIGRNGTGKSAIGFALSVFQSIGRGVNRVGQLVQPKDCTRSRLDVPIRFEMDVVLDEKLYAYTLALELPEDDRELRVAEECLTVEGERIYSRKEAQVTLRSAENSPETQFQVDWHLIALPIIQEQSEDDPLHILKTWLARMIILAPIPALMNGDSTSVTLEPGRAGANIGEWVSGVLSRYPAAYTRIDQYLREVMPDIQDFQNEQAGRTAQSLLVRFTANTANLNIYFNDLSDGEKCFFLCAVVLAANTFYGPLFCFWDEPDNYLSLAEVGHFITALRRSFKNNGQILVTSHHEEAIRKFSGHNTFKLDRKSHLEPTLVKLLGDVPVQGDLVDSLIRGDIA